MEHRGTRGIADEQQSERTKHVKNIRTLAGWFELVIVHSTSSPQKGREFHASRSETFVGRAAPSEDAGSKMEENAAEDAPRSAGHGGAAGAAMGVVGELNSRMAI